MINEKTVFILGEGANMPYEYFSGLQLKEEILNELDDEYYLTFLSDSEFTEEDFKDFRYSLFYSAAPSVDAFLEHRPEYTTIAKIAMTRLLILNENEKILFDHGNDKWYPYLFDNLLADSFEDFKENKISFITFNYDRSLEQFLFLALKNRYGKSDYDCANLLKNIPILHLLGKLNDLPWQNENGRPYDGCIDGNKVRNAANEIKVIHEEIEDDRKFKEAQEYIKNAQNIYFIGLINHKAYLDSLNICEFVTKGLFKNKKSVSYVFKLNGEENQFISQKFIDNIHLDKSKYYNNNFLEKISR